MNDRFKFRVWSYEQKRMINSWDYSSKRDFLYGALIDHRFFGKGLFITMQSTGLKDKNGTLIYEGDILRSEEYPFKNEESYNYAAEALWDDASATFYYYTFRISTNVVGRAEGNTGNLNDYEWEVIGNIYENKELLE